MVGDTDGTLKILVVVGHPIGYGGKNKWFRDTASLGHFICQVYAVEIIHIQRQVRPVLLNGAAGQDGSINLLQLLLHLHPGMGGPMILRFGVKSVFSLRWPVQRDKQMICTRLDRALNSIHCLFCLCTAPSAYWR